MASRWDTPNRYRRPLRPIDYLIIVLLVGALAILSGKLAAQTAEGVRDKVETTDG